MRKTALVFLMLVVAVGLLAQDTAKMSKYLWIEEPTLATGKHMAFEKLVGQLREQVIADKADMYWFAGSPLTGGLRQVSFVTFHDNYASMEKMFATMHKAEAALMMKNADFVAEAAEAETDARGIIAKYREDLSMNPTQVPIAEVKYWMIRMVTVKPGMMTEFADFMKQQLELVKKVNPNYPWIVYEVTAGVPGPAIIGIRPLRSLADMDVENTEATNAVFTPIVARHLDETRARLISGSLMNIYAVNPRLSHVPEAVMAANAAFWTIKESTPEMPAKVKKMKKTAEPAK